MIPYGRHEISQADVDTVIEDASHAIGGSYAGQKIGGSLHHTPVHLQPYYTAMGFIKGDSPEAEQDKVVAALTAAMAP